MKSVIRLDGEGNPYLICYYEDKEGGGSDANDDAERLFFNKLNQNGGLLHLVPGRDKSLKMIVTTGLVKRRSSVTESSVLGNPEPRAEAQPLPQAPLNHQPVIKVEIENNSLAPRLDAEEHDEFPPMHGGEETPVPPSDTL